MKTQRIRLLQDGESGDGPVIYWMSRDQRVRDNWALLHARQLAAQAGKGLAVVFCLVPDFLEATLRQYGFMLRGLHEAAGELPKLNIPFFLLQGAAPESLPPFLAGQRASALVADFDPLRIKREWKRDVAKKISMPFYEVDAHNIVPALYISQKIEVGARTLRPKIHRALPEFLDEFPQLESMPESNLLKGAGFDLEKTLAGLKIDRSVPEVDWLQPGETAAHKALKDFLENRLDYYDQGRNDPNADALSNLSPYLHFGQLSAQRIALLVEQAHGDSPGRAAFLEELIVRRELSDNFCYYNTKYDALDGFPNWAQISLNEHRDDKRDYVYSFEEFELAVTHEDLWNAAQMEMKTTGKMHGYMRMYWAKKILEWSASPEEALATAVKLNDKYQLDGRDPNGYTGCAWSIGGVHDRGWTERPVYGKIRYMNYNGAKRKFDTAAYVRRWTQ